MSLVDLHIHSNFSDGDKSISELIKILKAKRVELFSITDHDSVESIKLLNTQNKVDYIPGVEMSSIDENIRMHILGYGIKSDGYVSNECNKIRELRQELVYQIIEDLIKKKYRFSETDLNDLYQNTSSTIGKVDISKLLVKSNYVSTIDEAFKNILGEYKIGPKIRCDAKKIISLIKEDDGLAILAHPFEIVKKEKVDINDVIKNLLKYNIDGIEVYTPKHDYLEEKYILEICKKNNLLISGGSDYHGISKPSIEIGYRIKGENISERIKEKAIKH